MNSKIQNRIDELARRNTIRLDDTGQINSKEVSEEENLNTFRSLDTTRTLKGSREKNRQSNKSIAIIKE